MAGKVFIFDLDDTLIDNVHDYAEPILEMARLIISELGSLAPHVSFVVALEEELDLARRSEINPNTGKPFGYSMERFPGSLVETYRSICRKAGVNPIVSVETELYGVGLKAFDSLRYVRNIKPRVKEVFDFLKTLGDDLIIYTAGDSRVQNNKISALESCDIVSNFVKIVDKKTPDSFRQFLEIAGYNRVYSVGNNYNSDIQPALEAGYSGIYIPVETWETLGKMDEIRKLVDSTRCIELKSLAEIMDIYGELL